MSDEPAVLSRTARPPDRTVITGPHPEDVYDVWEPPTDHSARPARGLTVALIHGGFWRAAYDRLHLAPLAAALADDGFHVANLEYARVGMPRGGWPGTGTSVATQVGALASDDRLPSQRLVVGHSAGGHLALWLASQPSAASAAAGAIALAAVSDLRTCHRLGLSNDAVGELLGSTPDAEPAAWAAADPAQQRLRIPAVVVTAAEDQEVPGSLGAAYQASRQPDEEVTFVEVNDADHYALIDPAHAAYFTLLAHLEELELGLR